MPRIASIAVRICVWLTCAGSRVNSGSTWNGRGVGTTKSTLSPGMSTRGRRSTISFTCATTMPCLNAVASITAGLSLGVRPHIEVAVAVGGAGDGERHLRRQIDEVAGEQFDVGVDGAEFYPAGGESPRDRGTLRPRVGEVEFAREAALEQVEMLGEHDAGLHDVQVVQQRRVGLGERGGEPVRLLLVVALEADPVPRAYHRLEQRGRILGTDALAVGEAAPGGEAGVAILRPATPVPRFGLAHDAPRRATCRARAARRSQGAGRRGVNVNCRSPGMPARWASPVRESRRLLQSRGNAELRDHRRPGLIFRLRVC